jgi:hypothetical protein
MESTVEGKGTDSESNSFDKRDDMSEDELTVLGGKIGDADNVTIDESDDSKSKRGSKEGARRWRLLKWAKGENLKFGMSLLRWMCQILLRRGRWYQRQNATIVRSYILTYKDQQHLIFQGTWKFVMGIWGVV